MLSLYDPTHDESENESDFSDSECEVSDGDELYEDGGQAAGSRAGGRGSRGGQAAGSQAGGHGSEPVCGSKYG